MQPVLCNESVNKPKTLGALLEIVFYIRSMQSGYKGEPS
jgi:hypothetical protein